MQISDLITHSVRLICYGNAIETSPWNIGNVLLKYIWDIKVKTNAYSSKNVLYNIFKNILCMLKNINISTKLVLTNWCAKNIICLHWILKCNIYLPFRYLDKPGAVVSTCVKIEFK